MDNRTIEQVRENETIWINKAIKLEQENKQLKVELQEANDNIIWWSNRFNAVERDNKQLKEKIGKAIEYIKHSQSYGTMAQVMPHLKPYVNGDDLLEILGDKENE